MDQAEKIVVADLFYKGTGDTISRPPDTTLTPPRTQYRATWGKAEKGNWLRYKGFAILGKPLQRLMHQS
jgi:hypothetical protein